MDDWRWRPRSMRGGDAAALRLWRPLIAEAVAALEALPRAPGCAYRWLAVAPGATGGAPPTGIWAICLLNKKAAQHPPL